MGIPAFWPFGNESNLSYLSQFISSTCLQPAFRIKVWMETMSLAKLRGQTAVVDLLQRSIKRERLPHAYLFVGDRGSGKELVARELAKAVNCTAGRGDACDQCESCRKIESGNHPDVQWIRPESKSRRITIDQIRELMRSIYLKPSEGKMKVAVL